MTGLCVAAFGITCNDVIPNIFTSVVSKEDAVKESKVFQKWVIDKPFDNDQDDCNNGKPNGDVNDSFVWTVTVQKGESERGNERAKDITKEAQQATAPANNDEEERLTPGQ